MSASDGVSAKLFWMYSLAAINLYGAITVGAFVELVNYYEDGDFITEDFCCRQFEPFGDYYLKDEVPEDFNDLFFDRRRKILMSFDLADERCVQCEKKACDYCRIESGTAVRLLLNRQTLYKRYLPSKFEVLKYADRLYEAPSDEKKVLSDHIMNLTKDQTMTSDIVGEVSWGIRVTGIPSEYFQIYAGKGLINKLSPRELKVLIDKTLRLHNVTHSWYLNGNSPHALSKIPD